MRSSQRFHSQDNSQPNKRSTYESTFFEKLEKSNRKAKNILTTNHRKVQQEKEKELLKRKYSMSSAKKQQLPRIDKSSMDIEDQNLARIRKQRIQEQQQLQKLQNRLKYYQVERQRNQHSKKIAHIKYNSIMEIRHKSLMMKKSLSEQRKILKTENNDYIEHIRNHNNTAKIQHHQRLSNWKSGLHTHVSKVKQQKKQIEQRLNESKLSTISRNRDIARKLKQKQHRLSHQRQLMFERKKVKAKEQHSMRVFNEFNKKKELIKKNKFLYKKIIQASKEIKAEAETAKKYIQKVEQILSLKTSRVSSCEPFTTPYRVFLTKY